MTDAPLSKKTFPAFPGLWKALGPGIVWLALAQGSGELIWWPYIVAKYGLGFLFLLVPACLLQYPLNYEIGSYTLLTGESIFQGFIRLNRFFALCLWILATISFLWFGAFASAGGTSLAALTRFPFGWTEKGQTLFWAYLSMVVFLLGILASKVVYQFIEKLMGFVSVVTLVGLVFACSHPAVRASVSSFVKGLFIPSWPLSRSWDPQDGTKLLTAITFAGLGGFWTLFYSYWLREKGVGMARHMGHVTGPITGKREVIPNTGFTFEGNSEELSQLKKWKGFLAIDSSIGILGNIATTLMTCLLAYALLFPQGLLPDKYEIAVVQAKFFEVSWGIAGRFVFLFVAACFLADTWITTLDAVSRMHTDFVQNYFPGFRKIDFRNSYYFFIAFFTVVTAFTMLFREPGPLILLSAVIGFIGTVSFSFAILFLNHRLLPKLVPPKAAPGPFPFWMLLFAALMYLVLAVLYFGNLIATNFNQRG
jgi:hypothetical protein